MKKRKLLPIFSLLFLITILGVSCEKEDIEPVIPKEKPAKKFVTIVNTTCGVGGTIDPSGLSRLESGESKYFVIYSDDFHRIKSIKIKGISQPISDIFEVKALNKNDTLDIVVEFTPKDSIILLSKDKWYSVDSRAQVQDGVSSWYTLTWDDPLMYTDYYRTFSVDGIETSYYPDGHVASSKYTLDGDSLKLEGSSNDYKVFTLSKDTLTLEFSVYDKISGYMVKKRDTYAHIPISLK